MKKHARVLESIALANLPTFTIECTKQPKEMKKKPINALEKKKRDNVFKINHSSANG